MPLLLSLLSFLAAPHNPSPKVVLLEVRPRVLPASQPAQGTGTFVRMDPVTAERGLPITMASRLLHLAAATPPGFFLECPFPAVHVRAPRNSFHTLDCTRRAVASTPSLAGFCE